MGRIRPSAVFFAVVCFFGSALALAQQPTESEVGPAAGQGEAEAALTLEAALGVWTVALQDQPSLVSLGELPDLGQAGLDIQKVLRDRLKLIGTKTFSNRQWKSYWETQQNSAAQLAKLYAAEGKKTKASGMRAWAQLAAAKMENQDLYLNAIGTERDAVEERLEGALEPAASEPKPAVDSDDDPNPYQLRARKLDELEDRIAFHQARKRLAVMESKLIARQLESQDVLLKALKADADLAHREKAIARAQARVADAGWAAIWRPIARAAESKVRQVDAELELGEQRQRTLQVESNLAKSQMGYRSQKVGELETSLSAASSFDGWLLATYETVIQFLVNRAWKMVLVLVLIIIAMRVALRVVTVVTNRIVRAVEDDDDTTVSAAEQRANTVASVFKGVARIAVIAIAGLVGMETIGINTGPILGSVAILGLAISFGSQNLVRDLVNGFFILIENQYAVGDVVDS